MNCKAWAWRAAAGHTWKDQSLSMGFGLDVALPFYQLLVEVGEGGSRTHLGKQMQPCISTMQEGIQGYPSSCKKLIIFQTQQSTG